MSTYWFWCEEKGWPNNQHYVFLDTMIPRNLNDLYLWGEGAIPQILIYLWYLRSTDATIKPDLILASLLRQIIQMSTDEKSDGLPGPYYNFEDVTRHHLRSFLALKEDPFRGDSFRGIPDALKANKYLFVLFLILFPYRGTPSAIRYLGRQFNDSWSIEPPIL